MTGRRRAAERVPRIASTAVSMCVLVHLWASHRSAVSAASIPAWQWALLAAGECALLLMMLARPVLFRVRDFRLPGLAVTAVGLMVLVPLPWVVEAYGSSLPQTMMPALALGAVGFGGTVLALDRWATRSAGVPQHTHDPAAGRENRAAVWILMCAVALLPVWLWILPSIPIASLLTGRATGIAIATARYESLRGLGGPLRVLIGAMRNVYLMFAVAWMFADLGLARRTWRRYTRVARAALAALALGSAFALVTTERSLLGQLVAVATIAWLVSRRQELSYSMVAALAGAIAAFPLLFGFLLTGSASAAIESVRRRLFFVPADITAKYFAFFPDRHDFLHGSSIPKVGRLWGGATFDLSGYVYRTAYPLSPIRGNANGTFLGVGWANFGVAGVLLWCVVAAAALVAIERLLRYVPARTAAALRGVAAVQAVFLSSADVTRTVLGVAPGFLDVVALTAALTWIARRRTVSAVARQHQVADGAPQRRSMLQHS